MPIYRLCAIQIVSHNTAHIAAITNEMLSIIWWAYHHSSYHIANGTSRNNWEIPRPIIHQPMGVVPEKGHLFLTIEK